MDIEKLIIEMHHDLSTKVDAGFEKLGAGMKAHEILDTERFGNIQLSLQPLESNRQTTQWLIRTLAGALFVGIVAMGVDLWKNHMNSKPEQPVLNFPAATTREIQR